MSLEATSIGFLLIQIDILDILHLLYDFALLKNINSRKGLSTYTCNLLSMASPPRDNLIASGFTFSGTLLKKHIIPLLKRLVMHFASSPQILPASSLYPGPNSRSHVLSGILQSEDAIFVFFFSKSE